MNIEKKKLYLSKIDKAIYSSQMKTTFGEFIRKLRTENNLTLTQLAAKLDLDSANLSKIENSKRDFDEKRLKKLAIALNFDIEKLTEEYYSDLIAKKIYQSNYSEEILILAEQKIKYLKQQNISQSKIDF